MLLMVPRARLGPTPAAVTNFTWISLCQRCTVQCWPIVNYTSILQRPEMDWNVWKTWVDIQNERRTIDSMNNKLLSSQMNT